MKNILNAFEYFSQEILKEDFGAFFSVQDPFVGKKYFFGFGKYKEVDFKTFPSFTLSDWKGKKQKFIQFENFYSFEDLNFFENYKIKPETKNILNKNLKIEFSEKQKKRLKHQEKIFLKNIKKVQRKQKNGENWVLNLSENFEYEINFETKKKKKINPTSKKIQNKKNFLNLFYNFLVLERNQCGGVVFLKDDSFCSFSPEIFIHQEGIKINSFPIKGTGTKKYLETSKKEISEIEMIIDLIRNDLGKICKKVSFIDKRILTHEGEFFHARSKIEGIITSNFLQKNYLKTLLPAGSISGSPKQKTIEIIESLEDFERNYFTGIFGVKTSEDEIILNILIRTLFYSQKNEKYNYPVGVGVTVESESQKEWEEILQKQEILKKL